MSTMTLLYEHDADTRILVKFDLDDDDAPVELFNADDHSPIPNPLEGSALREAILDKLRTAWLELGDSVKKPAVVQ